MIVDLTTTKQFLQIIAPSEDTLVTIIIESMQNFIAQKTGIYFHDGDDTAIANCDGGNKSLRPQLLPINSVTKIEDNYDDTELTEDFIHTEMRIEFKCNSTYDSFGSGTKRWKVTYGAGYNTDGTDCPAGLKQVLLDLVYEAYWNRPNGSSNNLDYEQFFTAKIMKKLRPYSFDLRIR
ncbi:MAG: hypothetical protein DRQ46_00280 [Gammaproteobacteria bacterium]|nr:MAG: hypothetical protein DRQ46_00280 [Gammaproteobacteria bacterium]